MANFLFYRYHFVSVSAEEPDLFAQEERTDASREDDMHNPRLSADLESVKSKFSTNNFKKIRIPQFSETRFGSFVGLFLVYKQ